MGYSEDLLKITEEGLPASMPITDDIRYSYCDAVEATFASLEGKYAIYKGTCTCRHAYQIKVDIETKQVVTDVSIVSGELQYGDNNGFKATELGEY